MNYEENSKSFLEKTGTRCTIKAIGKTVSPTFGDNKLRNTFKVTLKNNNGSWTFKFYGNLVGDMITEYDVLAAITKYEVGTFEDFISEFGYNNDTKPEKSFSHRVYVAVCKEYANVIKLFGDNMEELQEIY